MYACMYDVVVICMYCNQYHCPMQWPRAYACWTTNLYQYHGPGNGTYGEVIIIYCVCEVSDEVFFCSIAIVVLKLVNQLLHSRMTIEQMLNPQVPASRGQVNPCYVLTLYGKCYTIYQHQLYQHPMNYLCRTLSFLYKSKVHCRTETFIWLQKQRFQRDFPLALCLFV